MNTATRNKGSYWPTLILAAVGGAILVSPDIAEAGHVRVPPPHRRGRIWVPPAYQTRARTITVPAIYEEQERLVWREPVYDVRQVRVDLPAEIALRRVARYDARGQLTGYKLVREITRPASEERRVERVLVRKGFHETVFERVCVRPETTKVVYEQVLVRPGHWRGPALRKVHRGPRYHGFPRSPGNRRAHNRGHHVTVRWGR